MNSVTINFLYFFFFTNKMQSCSLTDLSIFFTLKDSLSGSWNNLSSDPGVESLWFLDYSSFTFSEGVVSTSVFNAPSRTSRYTLSRGPMVRNNNSREQTQYVTNNSYVLTSIGLSMAEAPVTHPSIWFLKLTDVHCVFSLGLGVRSLINLSLFGASSINFSLDLPVLNFVMLPR